MDEKLTGFLRKKDKDFPVLLKEIKDCPEKLYYKGKWDKEIFENCLAVVGSRRMTTYGQQVEKQLVFEIATAGITIVSGFMYGGDAIAHQAALRAGGRTIAVMPCGIEIIHPAYQADLYHNILEKNGLIISEYEGKFAPTLWSYPRRNRIIAGLAKALLVVEAGLESGSLITAKYSKKFGRKIFAVPGPITSDVSLGTAKLLKEGATLVTSAQEILNYFGFYESHIPQDQNNESKISGLERKVIEELKREPLEIDVLVRKLETPISEMNSLLSLMELKDLIQKQGNKYYLSFPKTKFNVN